MRTKPHPATALPLYPDYSENEQDAARCTLLLLRAAVFCLIFSCLVFALLSLLFLLLLLLVACRLLGVAASPRALCLVGLGSCCKQFLCEIYLVHRLDVAAANRTLSCCIVACLYCTRLECIRAHLAHAHVKARRACD